MLIDLLYWMIVQSIDPIVWATSIWMRYIYSDRTSGTSPLRKPPNNKNLTNLFYYQNNIPFNKNHVTN